jgi:hypothetical protein
MSRLRHKTAFAVALSTVLIAPAAVLDFDSPARAEETMPTWGPVRVLAAQGLDPAVTIDRHGNTTVVWAKHYWNGPIRAVRRPAGGAWQRPVTIGRGTSPAVASDARGIVTAVWLTNRDGVTTGVAAARRSVSGRWRAQVKLSNDRAAAHYPDGLGVFGADRPDLAVSPSGATVVVWQWGSSERERPFRLQSVSRPPRGPWGAVRNLTRANWAQDPVVAIDPHRNAVVGYSEWHFGKGAVLKSTRRPAGRQWTAPVTLAAEGYQQQVAMDRAGNAILVWASAADRVRSRFRPAEGRWRAARTVSPGRASIDSFGLGMDGSGTSSVVWNRENGRVDLVRSLAGGSWSTPTRLGTSGTGVLLAVNRAGDTLTSWGLYGLVGRYQRQGSTWSDPFTIAPDLVGVMEHAAAAMAPNGDAVVVWKQEDEPPKLREMTASD